MIHLVGLTKENTIEKQEDFTNTDFTRFHWVWIDLEEPTSEEIKRIKDMYHFHPTTIEYSEDKVRRPKLEYYDDHMFYITHILREKNDEIIKQELNFFINEKYIVTVHQMPIEELNQIRGTFHEKASTYEIFHHMLGAIVESYLSLIDKIEEELEKIEDNTQNKKMSELMTDLFDIRKMLLHIGYTVLPMKDMLYQMLNSNLLKGNMYKRKYFSRIYDNLAKLSDMVTTNREIASDIRDNYLSLNSYQTNKLITVLTIIAAIFTPLTFIAGVYGMNFVNMPELNWENGYYIVLSLMAVIAVVMFLWFKVKGWFK